MQFNNTYASLDSRLYHKQLPTPLDNPRAGHFNPQVAEAIGWSNDKTLMQNWVAILSGHQVPVGFDPLAMAYAGHQFGQWAGQLGDGRGLLMAQVIDKKGQLTDLHLKGAGLTPYSRMGDGRAVLRSTIREYLCGHAMSNLGIASSSALGFVVSDTPVRRETVEAGAALMRVADSHIRLGHVEWIASFAPDLLGSFTHYMIEMYYPHLLDSKTPVSDFISEVVTKTAIMIADWQLIGFAHGVMNTDNLSITGSTLDYGPFGFLERFNPAWINNHSDYTGRYAYQNQPAIGHWNLNKWAQHFLALNDTPKTDQLYNKNNPQPIEFEHITNEIIEHCLTQYEPAFIRHYQQGICQKLGLPLQGLNINENGSAELSHSDSQPNPALPVEIINDTIGLAFELLEIIENNRLDYTNSFRALMAVVDYDSNDTAYETQLLNIISSELDDEQNRIWQQWQNKYQKHIQTYLDALNENRKHTYNKQTVVNTLKQANPAYILRNAMAQRAIDTAESGDMSEVDRLYTLLATPYQVNSLATQDDITPPGKDERPIIVSCSS